jgi:hypothetical protein
MTTTKKWDLQRTRLRHRGYQLFLGLEVLILLLQPLARHWPPLNSLLFISLAAAMVFTLTRYTPLISHRRASMRLGLLAIGLQLVLTPALTRQFSPPPLLILLHLGVCWYIWGDRYIEWCGY